MNSFLILEKIYNGSLHTTLCFVANKFLSVLSATLSNYWDRKQLRNKNSKSGASNILCSKKVQYKNVHKSGCTCTITSKAKINVFWKFSSLCAGLLTFRIAPFGIFFKKCWFWPSSNCTFFRILELCSRPSFSIVMRLARQSGWVYTLYGKLVYLVVQYTRLQIWCCARFLNEHIAKWCLFNAYIHVKLHPKFGFRQEPWWNGYQTADCWFWSDSGFQWPISGSEEPSPRFSLNIFIATPVFRICIGYPVTMPWTSGKFEFHFIPRFG